MVGTTTEKATDESLDELAQRMTAYRERATAARRLAEAISDRRATRGLIAHAEEFEKKAEAIATQIVTLAQCHPDPPKGSAQAMDGSQDTDGSPADARTEPDDR
jgi:hypothetical protein